MKTFPEYDCICGSYPHHQYCFRYNLKIHEEKAQESATKEQLVANEVAEELTRARKMFPGKQHSLHEGLGVLREEYIEFETEVFTHNVNKGRDNRKAARIELIQLAAMALRTVMDVIDEN